MRLPALPPSFDRTRDALHQIAFYAISPARYSSVGRMGLRATPGGFGTPEYRGQVARVEGALLVHEGPRGIASQTITTVRAAAEFFGRDYEAVWFEDFHDPLSPIDPDTVLDVDDDASRVLGQWFEFGFSVLERLRDHGAEGDHPSEVQLWPEHFDPATELGDPDLGHRASFGASPGDGGHPMPYVYVAPWGAVDDDPFWNDSQFKGASLGYDELSNTEDPEARALEFLLEGRRLLSGG